MQLYSHVIVCVVFLSSVSCNKVKPATVAELIGQKQYKDMLKKLVDNNEGRLETVKKWYRWNQQGLSDLLRSKTTNDLEDASEDDDKIVILVLKRESQKSAHHHSSSKVTKSGSVLDKILRKKSNWRDKSNKKAMKKCIKACNNAVKEVCKIFVCKSKYKSQFKKNCKSCCKARFLDKSD